MNRLTAELERVFGSPVVSPRAVLRVQAAHGDGLQAGRDEADRMVDAGADLVVLDTEGAGPAVVAVCVVLLDLDPTGLTADETLVAAARPHAGDLERLLAGDPILGRVTGLLEQLSVRRTVVLLGGGTTAAVAALVAARLSPGAERWWLAGSAPVDPAGRAALEAVGLVPLLDLGVADGGADLAMAVLRCGLELLGA